MNHWFTARLRYNNLGMNDINFVVCCLMTEKIHLDLLSATTEYRES